MNVMMKLGSFQFSISTAAYQQLTRKVDFNWASQDRFGRRPNLQFVGIGEETISLTGTIYTEYRGGLTQLAQMRALAARGLPQTLIDGLGTMLGQWVIMSVEEGQSVFAGAGQPRKQEFTLSLKYRESEPASASPVTGLLVPSTINWADKAAALRSLAEGQSTMASFADYAKGVAGNAVSTMASAASTVRGAVSSVTATVQPVLASVEMGMRTARDLQGTVANLQQIGRDGFSLANAQSALNGVMYAADSASRAGAYAASLTGTLGVSLSGVEGLASSVTSGVRNASAQCSGVTSACKTLYSDARGMITSLGGLTL